MRTKLLARLGLTAACAAALAMAKPPANAVYTDSDLTAKVVHEIRMYSRYTIWDNINVRVENGNVELMGEVSQPFKKADLQRIIDHIPGVKSTTNDLRVLPLSNFDDQLRVRVARAIFRDPVLSRYGMEALPPIHIIVENGHVTLEGVVSTTMEKNVAGIRANTAGLSFGQVDNRLRVENPAKASHS